MNALETGLRGGAIALLVLLAITSWRDARREPAARLTVLFDICAIAYLIESAPGVAFVTPAWIVPIRILSMATPAVFQHWAAASFDDFYAPKWWRWLPFAATAAIAAWAIMSGSWFAYRVAQVAALALVGAGIWETLKGFRSDLVEQRRRLRLALAIVAGVVIAAVTTFSAAASQPVRASATVVTAGGVLMFVLAFALLRLRTQVRGAPAMPAAASAAVAASPPAPAAAIDAEERALLDRLQKLMERDRIYREEAFGLARLAQCMNIPEYRLRRLINQCLGQRNFVAFVNQYRLAETMAALADPGQREVPVLTIALDAGFQSIGPFNRAFKAHTGVTPTEFRRARLEGEGVAAS